MNFFRACIAVTVFALATIPNALVAQSDSASLSGVVVSSETGDALPFAVVSIAALGVERFANDRGQFTLPKLPNGKYRVHVRQLGYSPGDVDVTLSGSSVRDVTVRLTRLVYRLDAIVLTADWTCDQPGRPTSGAQAEQIFDQIEQNADRLRLMSEQYPFELRGERWTFVRRNDGEITELRVDTAVIAGSKRVKYKAGSLVYTAGFPGVKMEYYLLLPTLADFADVDFQKVHCFVVRGVENNAGKQQLRVDFKVSSKLKKPDVEGSVFLDTANYQIRSTEIRLTSIPSQIKGVLAVRVTTLFREVRSGLPVPDGVHAETDLMPSKGRIGVYQSIEDQKPLNLKFLKQRPDSITAPDSTRRATPDSLPHHAH